MTANFAKYEGNSGLLAEYARTGSDAAVGELLTRYIDLVNWTAVRPVGGEPHLSVAIGFGPAAGAPGKAGPRGE